ncbi:hypothetical protein Q75_13405 [Bacillus coahuilensis p1.1.43]|uniref:NERD domain-containing protein n=2 Tax=Bacillus coahuilensis TaxID=408580 RepID=A0A147K5W1_9BACI|nr:nuclease-related domain-containing protein [Bacillus coahuilensis]KUP05242.1 hypothetical protein Q75_13405 [Bacillus coahuilensis p1.1.43]
MIVFPLKKSYPHLQLEALVTRVSPTHPSYETIVSDLGKRKIGYFGEERASYYFTLLPSDTCRIFHGLRLNVDNLYFQMDVLVLTPSFILVFEVKNSTRHLHYDSKTEQFYKIETDGRKVGTYNPIEQVHNQAYLLSRWLQVKGVEQLPIDYYVVRSNPKSVLEITGSAPHITSKFISSENIPNTVRKVDARNFPIILDKKTMKKVNQKLLHSHEDLHLDLFKTYDLTHDDIHVGVICKDCGSRPMVKKRNGWLCPDCTSIDKNSWKLAVDDWFYIMNEGITAKTCQHFLQLDSRHQAKRLLAQLPLEIVGENIKTTYFRKE